MPANQPRRIRSLHMLWDEWMCAAGALAASVVLALFISKVWLPLVIAVLAWALSYFVNSRRRNLVLRCVRTTTVCARSLMTSAFVMGICLVATRTTLLFEWNDPHSLNPQLPYITALVVFPVTAFWSAFVLLRTGRSRQCRDCITRLGYRTNEEMSEVLMHREARVQLKLLLFGSLIITAISLVYYLNWYSNASFNGRDIYIFMAIPVTFYIVSLFYTGGRYHRLIDYWQDLYDSHKTEKLLRVIVIHNGRVLVKRMRTGQFDTPCKCEISGDVSAGDVEALVAQYADTRDLIIKKIYSNDSAQGQTIEHYACYVPDLTEREGDTWRTLYEISILWRNGGVASMLGSELTRIYTVVMAWKTYTPDARRLYPTKNYTPTFRLQDFPEWDVDFTDARWLAIAVDNEDKPFFNLRRILRKIIGRK